MGIYLIHGNNKKGQNMDYIIQGCTGWPIYLWAWGGGSGIMWYPMEVHVS